MKNLIVLISLFLVATFSVQGQGVVRGKIADDNGEALIGVTVVLKSNKAVGTVTDFDGNYSLKITDATPQVIIVSYVSYITIEETVNPLNGQVVLKNFTMKSAAQETKEVEITAKAVKSKDYFMENIKKKSATSIDYVSSESMKKTGDNNVTAAISRVSGVSTNNGFLTVRGIGDRYIKTAVNGSTIPTLDPFTNNIQLDIFPTSLVDNILITKTASPDLPGDWAGAYISVETKDYPEKLTVNVESSFGYNAQSTFKDFNTTERSKTDWLGFDTDLRDRDHSVSETADLSPSQYEELVALGLGGFYNSLGVNQAWVDNSPSGDSYFKLGLIELGLLDKANFNDPNAFAEAKNQYIVGNYKNQAFDIVNKDVPAYGKSFPNNWTNKRRQAPLNFSQSFSVGDQTTLFGKTFGYIGGFRYSSFIQFDNNSIAQRASVDGDGNVGQSTLINQPISRETNSWSALLNMSMKLNSNNSVGFLFMPNFSGVNNVRDSREILIDQDGYEQIITNNQLYEERRQLIYQLKSEHFLPESKLRIESNFSYTDGNSIIPDFKNLRIGIINGQYQLGAGQSNDRFYRYLDENIFDSKVSVEVPFKEVPGLVRKLKFGAAYQRIDKDFTQYDYLLIAGVPGSPATGGVDIPNNDVDAFFDLENFGISTVNSGGFDIRNINLYYDELGNPANSTFGYSNLTSGFALADYAINPLWRVEGGLRVEYCDIFTDVNQYNSLGLPKDDPRRQFPGELFAPNPSSLRKLSFLPSVNVIYKIDPDDLSPINLRFNFSQTVARPSIRELSETIVRDYELRADVFGNADLKVVQINNYDLRFEYYWKSQDNFSVSLFYKDFKNHIELLGTNQGFTWQNVDNSRVLGIELEGRKKLTKNLELKGNVSFVNSLAEVVRYTVQIKEGRKAFLPGDTITRTMFGQAPYVINGILNYNLDSLGLGLTLSYNVQGPRLVIVSTDERPDIFEMPRNQFDFKATKTIGKHFNVSLTVRDILNTSVRRTYLFDNGDELDWERITFGTTYQVALSYKL